MNLKKLFGCGAALGAAACLFASPSQAYDETFHVYQAGNGVGDVLIFPVYAVGGTLKTNLRVVNTSSEYSVVAKVVFRESNSSCETRDFFIYLSPNDEWTADVVDVNGTTTIVSNDDSSPVVPLNVAMAKSCNGYGDKVGYVEVYGVTAMTSFTDITEDIGRPLTGPISKALIQKAYGALPTITQNSRLFFDNATTCVTSNTKQFVYSDRVYTMIYLPSQNVLAGVEEVKDPSMNLVMPMVATALANNCNKTKLDVQEETQWNSYGNNSAYEVRAALAKQAIHIPYRNDANNATFAVFNFPVKMSCIGSDSPLCTGTAKVCDLVGDDPEPCTDASKFFATAISQDVYDLQENFTTNTNIFSPAPPGDVIDKEVYITKLAPSFAEGWMRVMLMDAGVQQRGPRHNQPVNYPLDINDISYDGSAVIPSYLQVAYDLTWVPATFDCSAVKVGTFDTVHNSYIYQRFDNCTYQLAPNKMPTQTQTPS
jgi:hypothetical protein